MLRRRRALWVGPVAGKPPFSSCKTPRLASLLHLLTNRHISQRLSSGNRAVHTYRFPVEGLSPQNEHATRRRFCVNFPGRMFCFRSPPWCGPGLFDQQEIHVPHLCLPMSGIRCSDSPWHYAGGRQYTGHAGPLHHGRSRTRQSHV